MANSKFNARHGLSVGSTPVDVIDSTGQIASASIPGLDASKITTGTIDSARLPSYVDDVLEYTNVAALPTTGETGKIYVTTDTNNTYRWSGSVYVALPAGDMLKSDNLSGLTNATTARTNLGLGSAATTASTAYATAAQGTKADNALQSTSLKTINGNSLVGTGDITITGGGGGGDMFKSDNLSGLANIAIARSNLGLVAVASTGSYSDLTGKPTLGTASAAAAPTGTIVGTSDTQTLTNKRITSRTSAAVATPYSLNSDTLDTIIVTPPAGGITISVDAGTPTEGQKLLFRVKDAGTSTSLTFTAGTGTKGFRQVGVTVPGSTVAGKTMYIGCMYNATDTVWDIIAYGVQAA